MNNDLISRKEAIETIRSMTVHVSGVDVFPPEGKKSVIETLDLLPGVPLHNTWISVDDMLPQTDEWVAVWYRDKNGDYFPTVGRYIESYAGTGRKYWLTDVDNTDQAYPPEKITHWMPLPAAPNTDEQSRA